MVFVFYLQHLPSFIPAVSQIKLHGIEKFKQPLFRQLQAGLHGLFQLLSQQGLFQLLSQHDGKLLQ